MSFLPADVEGGDDVPGPLAPPPLPPPCPLALDSEVRGRLRDGDAAAVLPLPSFRCQLLLGLNEVAAGWQLCEMVCVALAEVGRDVAAAELGRVGMVSMSTLGSERRL